MLLAVRHLGPSSLLGIPTITTSMALTYPLITISTRAAVQKNSNSQDAYKGQLDAFRKILKEEGMPGLYSGLSSAMFGIAVTQGVYFYWYELVKATFEKAAQKKRAMTTIESIIAGALAGSATATLTNPIWVINTRLTVKKASMDDDEASSKSKPERTVLSVALKILKEEGIQGFFQGIVPALILVINPIIQFAVFERLKAAILRSKKALTAIDFFILGAVSKLVATGSTYPYIVVKSRMQLKQGSNQTSQYKSVLDGLRKIIKHEGVAGLYKGIESKLLASVMTSAFLFVFKEELFSLAVKLLIGSQFNGYRKMCAKVVIVGGGASGGLIATDFAFRKRSDVQSVSLIDASSFHEFTPATTKLLSKFEDPDQELPQAHGSISKSLTWIKDHGIDLIHARVVEVTETEVVLADGRSLPYDILVFAAGVSYKYFRPQSSATNPIVTPKSRVESLLEDYKTLAAAEKVLVIGGGLVGVEAAGRIVTDFPEKRVALVHSQKEILDRAPDARIGTYTAARLRELGVEVVVGERVNLNEPLPIENPPPSVPKTRRLYKTNAGRQLEVDFVIKCIPDKPNSEPLAKLASEAIDPSGYVKVDEFLRMEGFDNIFVLGDVNNVPIEKSYFAADMQAINTVRNIDRLLAAKERNSGDVELIAYKQPITPYAFELGDRAVAYVAGTPIGLPPLVVLGYAVLWGRWILEHLALTTRAKLYLNYIMYFVLFVSPVGTLLSMRTARKSKTS
ncbi:hypothetical protein HK102_002085 [Quaeritorhiza haematococci]|nr:hypothetical protein HK102_002085 [Quaeritorhiza haematococci]